MLCNILSLPFSDIFLTNEQIMHFCSYNQYVYQNQTFLSTENYISIIIYVSNFLRKKGICYINLGLPWQYLIAFIHFGLLFQYVLQLLKFLLIF